VLWLASMFISGVGGTILIGFDLGTTLIWLTLTLLGPLLVWGFVAAAEMQSPTQARLGETERLRPVRRAQAARPPARRPLPGAVRTVNRESRAVRSG